MIVSFLGDGHFGDTLFASLLGHLADLTVDLGIAVYTVPQN